MNAVFNQVEFIHRLEAEGLARGAAETIASGIDDGRRDLATTGDLGAIRNDLARFATRDELQTALARQIIQFGMMLGAGLAIAVAVIGVIVSAH